MKWCTRSASRPVTRGLAILIERIEEVGEQRAVGVVRKRHRIGTAAGALFLADVLLASVLVVDRDHAGREDGGALDADQLDPLREAGVLRRGRHQRAEAPFAKRRPARREVLASPCDAGRSCR